MDNTINTTHTPVSSTGSNFWKLVKKEVIENRKDLILTIISVVCFFIFIGALLGINERGGGFTEIFLFLFTAGILSYATSSKMFSDMKTKESRISTLMLPASVFEKFIVRWIAAVPLMFLLLFASFYVMDLSRVVAYILYTEDGMRQEHFTRIINLFTFIGNNKIQDGALIGGFILASYFFSQSIFLFGAILWPKLSFIKTVAALWVIQIVLGLLLYFLDHTITIRVQLSERELFTSLICIETVLTLGLYYLTYHRFRNSQVAYKLF